MKMSRWIEQLSKGGQIGNNLIGTLLLFQNFSRTGLLYTSAALDTMCGQFFSERTKVVVIGVESVLEQKGSKGSN